jgi:hypothetical protein
MSTTVRRNHVQEAEYLLGLDLPWPTAADKPFSQVCHPTTVAEYYHNFDKAIQVVANFKDECIETSEKLAADMHRRTCMKCVGKINPETNQCNPDSMEIDEAPGAHDDRDLCKSMEISMTLNAETRFQCDYYMECRKGTPVGGWLERAHFWNSVLNELTTRKCAVEAIQDKNIPLSTIMNVTVRMSPALQTLAGPYIPSRRTLNK